MSKQQKEQNSPEGRRGFLKLASVGAIVGGVAAVAGSKQSEAAIARKDGSKGYQTTEHVMKSYELARF